MPFNYKIARYNQQRSIKYRREAREVIRKLMIKHPDLSLEKVVALTPYSGGVVGNIYFYFKRHGL